MKQGDRLFTRYDEGSILEHVWAKQPLYLGAIYRIVRAWYDLGKQFSLDDRRGVEPLNPEAEKIGSDFYDRATDVKTQLTRQFKEARVREQFCERRKTFNSNA